MTEDKLRILLVDDEPGNLTALQAILEQDDRELVLARSGAEALRNLLDGEFALILLDVFMPGMDGFEVAELIRARERSRQTPIIFLTAAAAGQISMSRGYALGAVDYIIKPVEPEILRFKVAVFAELHRKSAEVKQQADELARERAFLNSVLEGATGHAITALDPAGRFQVWNEGARRMYGRNAGTMLGKHFDLLFSPDDVASGLPESLLQRIPEGGRIEVEVDQVRASGRTFPARITLSERIGAADNREGFVLIVRDITDQRQAEQARQDLVREQTARLEAEAAERLMQQMLDVLPEPAAIADADGLLTMVNAAARAAFPALELGMDVHGPDYLETWFSDGSAPYSAEHRPIVRALDRREVVVAEEVLLNRADGDPIPALANAAPVFDIDGTLLGAIIAWQDISTIKELDRQKDEFLAAVSHDMKSPLTVIAGSAQLLERRIANASLPDTEIFAEMLTSIRRTAMRAAAMVDELLDLARAQMNRPLQLDPAPMDLADVAQEVVSSMQSLSDRHSLHVEAGNDALTGEWDRRRIERVIANLVDNAIKFSPDGGTVTIDMRSRQDDRGDWAVLSVRDQGIGIPPEELARIFDRFYRGSNASDIGGSGVGLASVHRVISEHGGHVAVDSAPGQGTTVRIFLPRALALVPAEAVPPG
jgi:PAS domain S-box-containing protein